MDAGRLDQEHERTGAAIHDRHFGGGQLDDRVVDTQAGQGRQQVLDRLDLDRVLNQTGAKLGVADQIGPCRDFHGSILIKAAKHDAGIGAGRQQGHIDLAATVQTHASGADGLAQCALLEHLLVRVLLIRMASAAGPGPTQAPGARFRRALETIVRSSSAGRETGHMPKPAVHRIRYHTHPSAG